MQGNPSSQSDLKRPWDQWFHLVIEIAKVHLLILKEKKGFAFVESIEFVEFVELIEFIEFIESIELLESIGLLEFVRWLESIGLLESIGSIEFIGFKGAQSVEQRARNRNFAIRI